MRKTLSIYGLLCKFTLRSLNQGPPLVAIVLFFFEPAQCIQRAFSIHIIWINVHDFILAIVRTTYKSMCLHTYVLYMHRLRSIVIGVTGDDAISICTMCIRSPMLKCISGRLIEDSPSLSCRSLFFSNSQDHGSRVSRSRATAGHLLSQTNVDRSCIWFVRLNCNVAVILWN